MHGLYLLWWVGERGISPAVVAMILAAGDLALIALEVPAGWFADRFGHRASLIIGSSAQVLGMLACWLGQGVHELIAAAVLVALGDAFRSGADEALLYQTCVALHREEDFQKIEARTRAAGLVALVALLIAGGVIVSQMGFAVAWAVETALCALGLALACAMVEPSDGARVATTDEARERSQPEPRCPASQRFRLCVVMLILPVALLDGLASASSFLVQTEGTLDPEVLTVVVAGITLAEAGGAALAGRIARIGVRHLWLAAASGAGLAAATVGLPSGTLVAAVALSFVLGLVHPLRATLLQRSASDDARARVASLASACDVACSAVAVLAAGGWRGGHRSGRPSRIFMS
jgi:MFS family permease